MKSRGGKVTWAKTDEYTSPRQLGASRQLSFALKAHEGLLIVDVFVSPVVRHNNCHVACGFSLMRGLCPPHHVIRVYFQPKQQEIPAANTWRWLIGADRRAL